MCRDVAFVVIASMTGRRPRLGVPLLCFVRLGGHERTASHLSGEPQLFLSSFIGSFPPDRIPRIAVLLARGPTGGKKERVVCACPDRVQWGAL